MRILVGVTSHPLPVTDGMQLHVKQLLAELRNDHEVALVSPVADGDDVSGDALDEICSEFWPVEPISSGGAADRIRLEVITLASRRSKVAEGLLRSAFPGGVRAALESFGPDVVHLETGATAVLAPSLDVPTVVVPLDADDLNAAAARRYAGGPVRTFLANREARRWQRFERTAYEACDAVVVVTERDAEALLAKNPRLHVHVVPNGVDSRRFAPPDGKRDRDIILFHGAMDYAPNVDAAIYAATEVLPELRRRRPDVRLVLAGRSPSPRVLELASAHVEVTGELPDLTPLLRSASVYLCPMRLGSGIKNKLLEAFACGCPTVGTSVATRGMGITPGVEMLVADDVPGLVESLDQVLADPDGRAADLGAAARQRAEHLSWSATASGFLDVYRSAIERRTRGK